MIEIAVITTAFVSGLCVGIVLFIILGYVFVKKGAKMPIENLIK